MKNGIKNEQKMHQYPIENMDIAQQVQNNLVFPWHPQKCHLYNTLSMVTSRHVSL
jgi:hypothetical protein